MPITGDEAERRRRELIEARTAVFAAIMAGQEVPSDEYAMGLLDAIDGLILARLGPTT